MESTALEILVSIEPGDCWGKIIGEDSGSGACDLCVQICPAVFEKPAPDQCARVRPNADVTGYAEQVRLAAQSCPVDAICVLTVRAKESAQQLYKWIPVTDGERCTGCGLCVEACGPRCLDIVSGVAVLSRPNTCGSEEHCIAVCQDDAIHMRWVPMDGDRGVGRWKA